MSPVIFGPPTTRSFFGFCFSLFFRHMDQSNLCFLLFCMSIDHCFSLVFFYSLDVLSILSSIIKYIRAYILYFVRKYVTGLSHTWFCITIVINVWLFFFVLQLFFSFFFYYAKPIRTEIFIEKKTNKATPDTNLFVIREKHIRCRKKSTIFFEFSNKSIVFR